MKAAAAARSCAALAIGSVVVVPSAVPGDCGPPLPPRRAPAALSLCRGESLCLVERPFLLLLGEVGVLAPCCGSRCSWLC